MRRTKILATVGPASRRPSSLREMIDAGVDAFRLNLSHGSEDEHRATLRALHRATDRLPRPVALLADLPGPKIRLGPLRESEYPVHPGDRWTFSSGDAMGDLGHAYVSLPRLGSAARPGDPLVLGDGAVEWCVESARGGALVAQVVQPGVVVPQMGVHLPRARLRSTGFGPSDRAGLRLAVGEGIDYVALSFVRSAADIRAAREELARLPRGEEVGIIAKIERAEALTAIDPILAEADGIMVARGDLGIEVPLERLAIEQKQLVDRANRAAKVAIVATQVLLSMVRSPRPTRAEATDVANAVLDGADAVMLSEETAIGDHPIESVRWLDRILSATEAGVDTREIAFARPAVPPSGTVGSVAAAAAQLAREVGASAVVTPTHSGRTAREVARFRPGVPIVGLSSRPAVRRRLALVAGVVTLPLPERQSLETLRSRSEAAAQALGITPSAGPLVLTAGFPVDGRATNLVTIVERPVSKRTRRRRG